MGARVSGRGLARKVVVGCRAVADLCMLHADVAQHVPPRSPYRPTVVPGPWLWSASGRSGRSSAQCRRTGGR